MKPCLLHEWYGGDPAGLYASRKWNGARCLWHDGRLWSRGGFPIAAPAWFTRGLPSAPLDGELVCGAESLPDMLRVLALGERGDWRRVRFHVFDMPLERLPFVKRLARLEALPLPPVCRRVPHELIRDEAHLERYAGRLEGLGAEGYVLRTARGRYAFGWRTWGVMKYRFAWAEISA